MRQFLGKDGLTSTAANNLVNIAREFAKKYAQNLDNIQFYRTFVRPITTPEEGKTKIGEGIEKQALWDKRFDIVYWKECTALISYLNEAIKEKKALEHSLDDYSIEDYCRDNGIFVPVYPTREEDDSEFMNTLNIDQLAAYYMAEAAVSVYGKVIHDEGIITKARKDLAKKVKTKNVVTSSDANALIYTYEPTISDIDVEMIFLGIQNDYREEQKKVNHYKSKKDKYDREHRLNVEDLYRKELRLYRTKMDELESQRISYIEEKKKEYADLKIVIPENYKRIIDYLKVYDNKVED